MKFEKKNIDLNDDITLHPTLSKDSPSFDMKAKKTEAGKGV